MRKTLLKGLSIIMTVGLFVACSSDDEKHAEFAQIVESRSCESLLNDLYLGCDGDIEALARVLKATPSSIERLRKGETLPTKEFEERIKQTSVYYVQNNQDFDEVRAVLDEEYAWYDTVLDFPTRHNVAFWTINIVILLILAFAAIVAIWPLLIELLIFLIAWICLLVYSPEPMVDNYTDSINVTIERLK